MFSNSKRAHVFRRCGGVAIEFPFDFKLVKLPAVSFDPMVNGSNPPSTKLSLIVRRVSSSLESRCGNHEVWSHREGGPGHCSISRKLRLKPLYTK